MPYHISPVGHHDLAIKERFPAVTERTGGPESPDSLTPNICHVGGYDRGSICHALGPQPYGIPSGYPLANYQPFGGIYGTHLAFSRSPYIVRKCPEVCAERDKGAN